jgi:hypothetical protein
LQTKFTEPPAKKQQPSKLKKPPIAAQDASDDDDDGDDDEVIAEIKAIRKDYLAKGGNDPGLLFDSIL